MPFSFPSSPQPFAQSLHFSFFLSFFVLFFLSLLHFWHLSWLSFFKVVFSYSALISCQALCLCLPCAPSELIPCLCTLSDPPFLAYWFLRSSFLFVIPCSKIPFSFSFPFFLAFCRRLYWLSAYIMLISCIRSSILHSLISFLFALGPLIALERLDTCPSFLFVLFISPLVKTTASFFWVTVFSA